VEPPLRWIYFGLGKGHERHSGFTNVQATAMSLCYNHVQGYIFFAFLLLENAQNPKYKKTPLSVSLSRVPGSCFLRHTILRTEV